MKKILVRISLIILLVSISRAQTSVVLAPWAQFHSVTQSGQPNAFGCVFTYVSGTATPLATFTDNSGLTQNPNPVVLNASGSANIWVQSGTAYTFKVVSSGGVNCATGTTIYTVNGIAGGGSSVVTTVAFSTTPNFTVTAQNQVFLLTLTGNAAALPLSFSGVAAPAFVTFQITEDVVGGHTFTYPANALGAAPINTAANQTTTQTFIWNGTTTTAVGPAVFGTASPTGTISASTVIASTSVNSPIFQDVTNPALSGTVRLASTDTINWRNNANNGDLIELSKNVSDQFFIGCCGSSVIYNGPLSSATANVANSGTQRMAASDTVCWRNNANSADVCLGKNGNDILSFPNGYAALTGGFSCQMVTKLATYTLTINDCVVQGNVSGGGFTLTVPHAAIGQLWKISRIDTTSANTLTIAGDTGTVNGLASITLPINSSVVCHADGTNIWCTQGFGDTRDFSVTGCTPASSTDSQCTGTITISPAMANNNYIPILSINNNGTAQNASLTLTINGSITSSSIPYAISCTFFCSPVNTPTIYVHVTQK